MEFYPRATVLRTNLMTYYAVSIKSCFGDNFAYFPFMLSGWSKKKHPMTHI